MRVGHTRCMVDGNFSLIKVYRHGDIDAVSQLVDIVNRSSSTNQAQLGLDRMGFLVRSVLYSSEGDHKNAALRIQE